VGNEISDPTARPADTAASNPDWWRDAVFYQIYPRSFADANGDGVGDLDGIRSRLDHLAGLGVDAIWLSPFFTSPMADHGYDVADPRDVDPVFGDLAAFDRLVAEAHARDIKVTIDLVPNHSSDEHVWFQQALRAAPGSPERDRYVFRDGRGVHGEQPPNNWPSAFGGPAWHRITEPDGTPGQWYLHLFDTTQPDYDWNNPDVHEEFRAILRFWLDRGVDGFRVDVAHGLVKAEGLPSWDRDHGLVEVPVRPGGERAADRGAVPPMWDQEGVHDIYREWRSVLEEYPHHPIMVAEAWVDPPERLARYVRRDEMHQAFNFAYLQTAFEAGSLKNVVSRVIAANASVGAAPTWVLSNHDVVRHTSRLALGNGPSLLGGVGADDPQPDEELGLRRGRAASLLMLALPGSAYLYQGEELGLPEATRLPDDARQDPTWFRSEHRVRGRDGCRVPIPWSTGGPSFGFGPTDASWLPQPEEWERYAASAQVGVPGSTLEFYREALRLRRREKLGSGSLLWLHNHSDVVADASVLAFGNGRVQVLANTGTTDVPLPRGLTVLLASEDLKPDGAGRLTLPPDTTAWLTWG
jgi:alpha-glucosidase